VQPVRLHERLKLPRRALVLRALSVHVRPQAQLRLHAVAAGSLHAGAVGLGVVVRLHAAPDDLGVRLQPEAVVRTAPAQPADKPPVLAGLRRGAQAVAGGAVLVRVAAHDAQRQAAGRVRLPGGHVPAELKHVAVRAGFILAAGEAGRVASAFVAHPQDGGAGFPGDGVGVAGFAAAVVQGKVKERARRLQVGRVGPGFRAHHADRINRIHRVYRVNRRQVAGQVPVLIVSFCGIALLQRIVVGPGDHAAAHLHHLNAVQGDNAPGDAGVVTVDGQGVAGGVGGGIKDQAAAVNKVPRQGGGGVIHVAQGQGAGVADGVGAGSEHVPVGVLPPDEAGALCDAEVIHIRGRHGGGGEVADVVRVADGQRGAVSGLAVLHPVPGKDAVHHGAIAGGDVLRIISQGRVTGDGAVVDEAVGYRADVTQRANGAVVYPLRDPARQVPGVVEPVDGGALVDVQSDLPPLCRRREPVSERSCTPRRVRWRRFLQWQCLRGSSPRMRRNHPALPSHNPISRSRSTHVLRGYSFY